MDWRWNNGETQSTIMLLVAADDDMWTKERRKRNVDYDVAKRLISFAPRFTAYSVARIQTSNHIQNHFSHFWTLVHRPERVCVCVCAVWYILFFSHSKSAHMRTCTRKRFRKRQKLRSLRSEYLNLTFAHTHPMEFTGNNQFSALCLFIDSFTRRYIVNEKLDERRFFCEEYFLYLFRFRCLSNWHSC